MHHILTIGVDDSLRQLHTLMNRIRKLTFPTFALINGPCLGGGLEFAIACDYRIVVNSDKVILGYPEVKLGLCPGAGGCVYTPQMIGLLNSLDLLLSGDPIGKDRALQIGLVDRIIDSPDEIKSLLDLPKKKSIPWNFLDKAVRSTDLGRAMVYNQVTKQLHLKTRLKYPAPYWILEVMLNSLEKPLLEAIDYETKTFKFLLSTKIAKESIKMFLFQDGLKKINVEDSWIVPKKIGIIGAGLIGTGLTHHVIMRGFEVVLIDLKDDVLKESMSRIELLLKHSGVDSKKIELVKTSCSLEDLKEVDLIFEAIPEDLDAKKTLLSTLEKIASPRVLIVSCTSSLCVSQVFQGCNFKNFARMNFEYPIFKFPYVEVTTESDQTFAMIQKLCKEIKKIPYRTKESVGNVSTRLMACVLSEILDMIHSGYKTADIQQSINTYGLSIKVLDLLDAIGIDQFYKVIENLYHKFPNRFSQNAFITTLYKEQSFGRKTMKGFSLYLDGGRKDIGLNDTFREELAKIAKKKKVDILERILFRLLNEALYIVDEGLVHDSYVVDLITSSLGITAFQEGGIFAVFSNWKPSDILDRLKKLQGLYGDRFTPCPLLKERCKYDRLLTNEKATTPEQNFLVTPFDWDLFPKQKNHGFIYFKWGGILMLIVGFILIKVFTRTK